MNKCPVCTENRIAPGNGHSDQGRGKKNYGCGASHVVPPCACVSLVARSVEATGKTTIFDSVSGVDHFCAEVSSIRQKALSN